jgi:hypothetical protein
MNAGGGARRAREAGGPLGVAYLNSQQGLEGRQPQRLPLRPAQPTKLATGQIGELTLR